MGLLQDAFSSPHFVGLPWTGLDLLKNTLERGHSGEGNTFAQKLVAEYTQKNPVGASATAAVAFSRFLKAGSDDKNLSDAQLENVITILVQFRFFEQLLLSLDDSPHPSSSPPNIELEGPQPAVNPIAITAPLPLFATRQSLKALDGFGKMATRLSDWVSLLRSAINHIDKDLSNGVSSQITPASTRGISSLCFNRMMSSRRRAASHAILANFDTVIFHAVFLLEGHLDFTTTDDLEEFLAAQGNVNFPPKAEVKLSALRGPLHASLLVTPLALFLPTTIENRPPGKIKCFDAWRTIGAFGPKPPVIQAAEAHTFNTIQRCATSPIDSVQELRNLSGTLRKVLDINQLGSMSNWFSFDRLPMKDGDICKTGPQPRQGPLSPRGAGILTPSPSLVNLNPATVPSTPTPGTSSKYRSLTPVLESQLMSHGQFSASNSPPRMEELALPLQQFDQLFAGPDPVDIRAWMRDVSPVGPDVTTHVWDSLGSSEQTTMNIDGDNRKSGGREGSEDCEQFDTITLEAIQAVEGVAGCDDQDNQTPQGPNQMVESEQDQSGGEEVQTIATQATNNMKVNPSNPAKDEADESSDEHSKSLSDSGTSVDSDCESASSAKTDPNSLSCESEEPMSSGRFDPSLSSSEDSVIQPTPKPALRPKAPKKGSQRPLQTTSKVNERGPKPNLPSKPRVNTPSNRANPATTQAKEALDRQHANQSNSTAAASGRSNGHIRFQEVIDLTMDTSDAESVPPLRHADSYSQRPEFRISQVFEYSAPLQQLEKLTYQPAYYSKEDASYVETVHQLFTAQSGSENYYSMFMTFQEQDYVDMSHHSILSCLRANHILVLPENAPEQYRQAHQQMQDPAADKGSIRKYTALLGSVSRPRNIIDFTLSLKSGRATMGSTADVLRSIESDQGKPLTCSDYPLHRDFDVLQPHESNAVLWDLTANKLEICGRKDHFPTSSVRTGSISTPGTYRSSNGVTPGAGLSVSLRAGQEVWYIATPRNPALNSSDGSGSFSAVLDRPSDYIIEVIVLVSGVKMILRPNTTYLALTLSPSVGFVGSFFATCNLQDTVFGIFRAFASGKAIQSGMQDSFMMLTHVLAFFHQHFVLDCDTELQHLPDLSTMTGILDILSLGCLVELGNVVNDWGYTSNNYHERARMICARRRARELIQWIFGTYRLRDQAGDFIDGRGQLYWPWLSQIACALLTSHRVASQSNPDIKHSSHEVHEAIQRAFRLENELLRLYLEKCEDGSIQTFAWEGFRFEITRRKEKGIAIDPMAGHTFDDERHITQSVDSSKSNKRYNYTTSKSGSKRKRSNTMNSSPREAKRK